MSFQHREKYLSLYAQPQVKDAQRLKLPQKLPFALGIPLYDEDFRHLYSALSWAEQHLCLLIIHSNVPVNATQKRINNTANCHQQLLNYAKTIQVSGQLSIGKLNNGSILLLVNGLENALPVKKGVGLARKIIADIALQFYHQGHLVDHYFYSSDADAQQPDVFASERYRHYYQLPNTDNAVVAQIADFNHYACGDSNVDLATTAYQHYLMHYQKSLAFAGSSYAFQSLGSTLSVHYDAYAKVRGFPQRAAGEDFYLLNKLIKIGRLGQLQQSPVQIRSRLSHRIPFGTGPATDKILQQGGVYHFDQRCFDHLQIWLKFLDANSQSDADFKHLNSHIINAAQFLGFQKWQRSNKNGSGAFNNHHWFDGLRTLQFLHYLQQHHYPANFIPLEPLTA